MKKLVWILCMAACVLTACKDTNTFTLTGTFASGDLDGTNVCLQQLDSNFRLGEIIDTTTVANGAFIFNGVAEKSPVIQFVSINGFIRPTVFVVEKGKIEMNFDSGLKATVGGTVMNDRYQLFETKKAGILEKEELQNVTYDFLKPHIATPAGQYFFFYYSFYLNDGQMKELIPLSTPDFQQLESVQKMLKRAEAREATAVGKTFTDVKGFDLNDKEVSLSDYAGKGKVVLVDFWASWCRPCIQEIPNVRAVYNEYKDKGFEIVGISLDERKDDWKKAAENLNLTWPQMSNLKGWAEDCAVAYGVNSIPQTVLIDKDGKIIERNFRVDELKFTLDELLGNK